jgi:hypothetical protein
MNLILIPLGSSKVLPHKKSGGKEMTIFLILITNHNIIFQDNILIYSTFTVKICFEDNVMTEDKSTTLSGLQCPLKYY